MEKRYDRSGELPSHGAILLPGPLTSGPLSWGLGFRDLRRESIAMRLEAASTAAPCYRAPAGLKFSFVLYGISPQMAACLE